MSILIDYSLFAIGIVGFCKGVICAFSGKHESQKRYFFVSQGIFLLFWCCGYALMGASTKVEYALFFRNVGLLGVLGFLISETAFFLYITEILERQRKKLLIGILLWGILDYLFFSRAVNIKFVLIQGRMSYYARNTVFRLFHNILILFFFVFLFGIAILWYRKTVLKREKYAILLFAGSNITILLGTLADTFIPLFGIPSFPATGYGAFLTYMLMCFAATKKNVFEISRQNIGSYLYQYINAPVLVFDYSEKLVMANDYAVRLFQLNCVKGQHLEEIFELTREASHDLFSELTFFAGKTYKLSSLNNKRTCALSATMIADPYQAPYCYICIGYDLTRENAILNDLENMKQQLEIQLQKQTKQVERTNLQTITSIANIIDARDEENKGHSIRVAVYCEKFARTLQWKEEDVQNLKYVALLHDIGKIGVSDMVLLKRNNLTEEEYKIFMTHTTIGGEIVKDIAMISGIEDGVRSHHERWDGLGYPDGLSGKKIPMIAQIIGIVDFYVLLKEKAASEKEKEDSIKKQMLAEKGKRFEPQLLEDFMLFLENTTEIKSEINPKGEDTFAGESSRLFERIIHSYNNEEQERDYLTNLWNRRHGEKLILKEMQKKGGCLAFIDLDNLKYVNDIYGHFAGDYALKMVGAVLQDVGENCISSRIGGDEFLIFFMDSSYQEAISKIEEICSKFQQQKEIELFMRETSLSIGCYMCKMDSTYQEALQKADKALYHVKQNGKKGYFFYQEDEAGEVNTSTVDLQHLMKSLQLQGNYTGAFNVNHREFSNIYRFIANIAERYDQHLELIIITVSSKKECFLDTEKQEEALYCMEKAVCETLRRVDVSTRFSSSQMLIILNNAEQKSLQQIMDRIFQKFHQQYPKDAVGISYDMAEYK